MNKEKNNKTEKNNTNMENKHKFSDKVKFHPWVGDKYEYGIKGFDENGKIVYGTPDDPGKKLLVLGESHYCAELADAVSELITIIIKDLLNPDSEWEPYKNTYTKFIKSLTGYTDDLEFEDKKEAWEHLAFYNYVQVPMTGPRISPTTEDFKKSEEAFWEVLNELKPDLIIVWGKRLYNNLPQGGRQLKDLEVKDENGYTIYVEVWSYEIDNKDIPIIGITHPSSGFDTKFWHKAIELLLITKY